MDASSRAAAALAVALEDSRAAAPPAAQLERERLAMSREDMRSWVAQHLFVESVQPPRARLPLTWEVAYEVRHSNYLHAQEVLRAVRAANRRGDAAAVEEMVADELSSSSDEDAEEVACVLCQRLTRRSYMMPPWGRWEGLAQDERLLCGSCFQLQPPQ